MTILQLIPFDLATTDPTRIMAPMGFWSSLSRLTAGQASIRLLMVADALRPADVLLGFQTVAVPPGDLPGTMRWYHNLYQDFLRQAVQTTRYMKLYLVMNTALDETALVRLLGTYGIKALPLTAPIPLPFQVGQSSWNRVRSDDGQQWAVVRSRLQQTGAAYPEMLHRLFALDFPVWAALDIYTFSTAEATRLLRQKQLSALYERGQGEAQDEAQSVTSTVRDLRYEITRLGAALHQVRLSVVVGAASSSLLQQRLELIRGATGMEMEGWEAGAGLLPKLFQAAPPTETDGAMLTSTGLSILTGSALSYRRRTNTTGIFVGIDQNQAPVVTHIFSDHHSSYNSVVLGQTGAGKTFAVLLMMLRHLLLGVRLIIIDPQGNIDLGFLGEDICHKSVLGTSGASINILDIVHSEIANQVEGVLALFALLGITTRGDVIERAILDEVLMDIYRPLWGRDRGITVPGLGAVQVRLQQIAADDGRIPAVRERAAVLAYTLIPYVTGSRAALFGRQTTVNFHLEHPISLFDISQLPPAKGQESNLRAALLSILVADINQGIRRRRREGDAVPILFFVDEMGILMREPIMAAYISQEYKTARSRRVGMIVADQDLPSFLGPADASGLHHGQPMLANSATQYIFRQQSSQLARIREHFPDLPPAMINTLPLLPQGTCIARLPDDVLQLAVMASPFEQAVLSSRLQDRERARRLMAQMVAETGPRPQQNGAESRSKLNLPTEKENV